eukprot:s3554_g6.t1
MAEFPIGTCGPWQELYFFGYILTCYPGQSAFGQPRKSVQLGYTLRTVEELNAEIKRVYFDYRPDLYDAFDHNCNDLSPSYFRHENSGSSMKLSEPEHAVSVDSLKLVLEDDEELHAGVSIAVAEQDG